jgi:outer membrane protein assembly factor BamE
MPVFSTASCISISRIASRLALTLATGMVVSACSTFDKGSRGVVGIISPYKADVVQGNFVSKEQKEALQVGMQRAQVREILGSPLVTSAFHADRWDYVFTIRRQGQEPQQRKLAVFFKADELIKVDSDELIAEEDFVTSLSTARKLGKVPLMEVPQDVLREFGLKTSSSNTVVNPADPALGAADTRVNGYPPLEVGTASAEVRELSPQRVVQAPAMTPNPVAVIPAITPGITAAPVAAPIVTPAVIEAPAAAPAAIASAQAPAQIAPLPAAPAIALAPTDPEIVAFVNRWVADWQSRNATAYFSHYVPQFKGTSATRAEWEAQRRLRIEGRSRISVVASDIRARTVSPTEARLVFRQVYESDVLSEVGTKAMLLIKQNGRWMIEREFFTPSQ